jgi:transcriptional regulator with XRE-family HTH domain
MCAQKSRSIVDRFPEVLRKVRTDKGLSQEELADLAGLHRTYISQIERGLKSPSLRSLEKIANGLGITLSELLRRLEA